MNWNTFETVALHDNIKVPVIYFLLSQMEKKITYIKEFPSLQFFGPYLGHTCSMPAAPLHHVLVTFVCYRVDLSWLFWQFLCRLLGREPHKSQQSFWRSCRAIQFSLLLFHPVENHLVFRRCFPSDKWTLLVKLHKPLLRTEINHNNNNNYYYIKGPFSNYNSPFHEGSMQWITIYMHLKTTINIFQILL